MEENVQIFRPTGCDTQIRSWGRDATKVLLKRIGDNDHVSAVFKFFPRDEMFVFPFKMHPGPKYP